VGTRKTITRAITTLLVCASAVTAQRADIPATDMVLEIPELQVQVEANDSKVLPSNRISYFQVRIPGRGINSGTVHTRINTESANIIMTMSGTADGILCNFDLKRRGGFEIAPGRNSVEVEYTDRYQRIHYASYLLIVPESSAGVPLPPRIRPVTGTGTTYAVVVGISKYLHGGAGLQNLKYADRDAQAFLDFLRSPAGGGVRKENIQLLLNEDATAENLRTALYTFLTRPTDKDTVLIFIAGHGDEDPNDNRNLYFLTYDTDPENMGGTAFLMSNLQEVYQRVIKAKRVVTFADSCHSFGISGQRSNVSRKENNLINQYLKQYASEGERDVITASDVSELSQEDERWGGGHGVFTYFLLQGLQGKAADREGNVTAGQLFAYVKDQVRRATANAQKPQMTSGSAAAIPLSGPLVRAHN
jgi:Caspase domain